MRTADRLAPRAPTQLAKMYLVCVDGSEQAQRCLRLAAFLRQGLDRVLVLTVHVPPEKDADGSQALGLDLDGSTPLTPVGAMWNMPKALLVRL